jgi:glycosyltransferase involved in cell wall biosynthesis
MQILVIYTGAYPKGQVTTHRVHNICKGLVEHGVDVEILLTRPTQKDGSVRNLNASGTFEGVKYRHVRNKHIRSSHFMKRRWDDFICSWITVFHLLFNKAKNDIVLIIGPSFDFRLFLPVVGKFTKSKMVLEVNEYPFVTRGNTGWPKFKRRVLFNVIFPMYDGFIVISEELSKIAGEYKSTEATIIKIPILTNPVINENVGTSPISNPYIIHAGSLSEEKDGMNGLLEAFALARKKMIEDVRLVITGNAKRAREYVVVKETISRLGIEDAVVFTGFLENDDLRRYFSNASLAIINKLDTIQNRYCFPTKLADYCSYGIPVITTTVGESKCYLQDQVNAYIVAPESPQLLADKVVQAFASPDERMAISRASKELSENSFSAMAQGRRLIDVLEGDLCAS